MEDYRPAGIKNFPTLASADRANIPGEILGSKDQGFQAGVRAGNFFQIDHPASGFDQGQKDDPSLLPSLVPFHFAQFGADPLYGAGRTDFGDHNPVRPGR